VKQAVQFGAGNIGRGFLGQLFFESGYRTTFVDVVPEVVEGLRARGAYPLRIVGDDPRELTISNVTAVSSLDMNAVAEALSEADIAATAVGVNVLPRIAPALAAGIARRFARTDAPPLNIIVCENLIDAGPFLREHVRTHLDARFHDALDEKVGFVEASIGRMVPIMTPEQRAEDPLRVCVEAYCDLPVDANGFRGPIPPLAHMMPRPNFKAYVERKLFVHNAGHATTAYLGYLRGHEYIWQAIADPPIRTEADAAMAETCAALSAKHGMPLGELQAHWTDLIERFQNKALGDQILRVAADPIRKLGPKDRLIGAALMCLEQGVEPSHVAFAAAAAMLYDPPHDAAACRLQDIRAQGGLDAVLNQVCQIPGESHLAGLIRAGTERLRQEGWIK
ncbi:MAG TPA: mannitol-1-phosphate 5-dehydrogenase, partial [Candidatus Hydrogenedentes bacterium]|nr:mannitol-1-phosphate 5-dehydrogenase [Candidatus Hydrogenedentota bacterium]